MDALLGLACDPAVVLTVEVSDAAPSPRLQPAPTLPSSPCLPQGLAPGSWDPQAAALARLRREQELLERNGYLTNCWYAVGEPLLLQAGHVFREGLHGRGGTGQG